MTPRSASPSSEAFSSAETRSNLARFGPGFFVGRRRRNMRKNTRSIRMKLTTLAAALAVAVGVCAKRSCAGAPSHRHGISHRYGVHHETGRHRLLRTVTWQRGLHVTVQLGATKMRRWQRPLGRRRTRIRADMVEARAPGRRRARTTVDTEDARAPGAVGRCDSWSAVIPGPQFNLTARNWARWGRCRTGRHRRRGGVAASRRKDRRPRRRRPVGHSIRQ